VLYSAYIIQEEDMDNSKPKLPESQPEPKLNSPADTQPNSDASPGINEWINHTTEQAKGIYKDGKEYYRKSPRLQKFVYQGKFMPAFWTVACIFSLVANIILIGLLISVSRHFFELKALVSDGLLTQASNNLAMMDKSHIVLTVPVETTVRLQDTLPVTFDLPINQSTQLSLAEDTTINGAYIYLNNTAVQTDLTLPSGTPLQANFNMSIPVSTTVPVDFTVPVSIQVPVDIAIDQTDLHQSIVGLQEAIKPYQTTLGTTFNSPDRFLICKNWLTGWLCSIIFGEQ
jgi:hypothetical protein